MYININTIGHVTEDFQVEKGESGVSYARFNLAVNPGYGKNAQKPIFLKCVVFSALAEQMGKAKVKRGSALFITGTLNVEEYERKDMTTGFDLKVTVQSWSYPYAPGKAQAVSTAGQIEVDTVIGGDTGELP